MSSIFVLASDSALNRAVLLTLEEVVVKGQERVHCAE